MPSRRDRVAVVVDDARTRRWPRRIGIALTAALILFFGGGGWYFSGLIRTDALLVEEHPPEYDFTVTGVSPESITFTLPGTPPADLLSSETLGVRWEDGYGLSGPVLSRTDEAIAKQFTLVAGTLPTPGTTAAFEANAVPPDPADAGISYETVTYVSAFGEFDAWLTPGNMAGTWAIFIHGRGATPHEGIRILPAFADRGIPMLLIDYRNDPGAPATDDHLATFGIGEREDLEGAVAYALDHGAEGVVLVGYSMGGAIAMGFLYESDLADEVGAVILDAPALELGAMVDARAADTSLPLLPFKVPVMLTAAAKWMAGWRFGADWSGMDYLDERAAGLTVPILVLHGVEDDTVPIALSRELADRLPGIVELVEFPGAGHVRSWNVDPTRYDAAVAAFLDRVAG
ncbi:MAG: lysophospholipase [Actinobacteria bacterium]|nr:lysophospholipase [Actinomycetota bacterium]MBU1494346.1 lysophospholipase [Actinomycetota bacterium]